MSYSRIFSVKALVFFSIFAALPVSADDKSGKDDFFLYCYSCHGMGKGDGPMSASLASKPTDLTQLSKSRGGHFPYLEIRSIIDGRSVNNSNRSHFKSDMPIWGDVFVNSKSSSPAAAINGEAVAKMRILNIVDYLASIQEKCTGDCK